MDTRSSVPKVISSAAEHQLVVRGAVEQVNQGRVEPVFEELVACAAQTDTFLVFPIKNRDAVIKVTMAAWEVVVRCGGGHAEAAIVCEVHDDPHSQRSAIAGALWSLTSGHPLSAPAAR